MSANKAIGFGSPPTVTTNLDVEKIVDLQSIPPHKRKKEEQKMTTSSGVLFWKYQHMTSQVTMPSVRQYGIKNILFSIVSSSQDKTAIQQCFSKQKRLVSAFHCLASIVGFQSRFQFYKHFHNSCAKTWDSFHLETYTCVTNMSHQWSLGHKGEDRERW